MNEGLLLLFDVIVCVFLVLVPKNPQEKSVRRTEIRLALTILVIASGSFLSISAFGFNASWLIPTYLTILTMIALCFIHPWLLVRGILIPFGLSRFSYQISRLGGFPWMRDPYGGAVLAATLALLQQKQPSSRNIQWIESLIRQGCLGGASLAALGLIYAIRGDSQTTRSLFRSIDQLEPSLCPSIVHRIVLDWQMLDLAKHGDWKQLMQLGQQAHRPSRLQRFLLAVSRRFCGEAISQQQLFVCWCLAPKRRYCLSLLRKAVKWDHLPPMADDPRILSDEELAQPAANDGSHFSLRAFSMHLELLQTKPEQLCEAVIRRLVLVWGETFADPRWFKYLHERTLAVHSSLSAKEISKQLQRHIIENLACVIRKFYLPWKHTSHEKWEIFTLLTKELDRQQLQVTEEFVQVIEQRIRTKNEFSIKDIFGEWQFWLLICKEYQERTAGVDRDMHKKIFLCFEQILRQYALYLWKYGRATSFVTVVLTWLLLEAESVGCKQSAKLYGYNLVVGF